MMKKTPMSAVTLRTVLSVLIVLTIILSGVGFYFGQTWLNNLAVSVSHQIADSRASGNNVEALKKLQQDVAARQESATRARSISSSAQNYQTQTIYDLDKYAASAGISISNYSFVQTSASAAPVATATITPTVAAPSTAVTITVTSPVSYVRLLKFMSAIESNLPKMQVSSVNLGRPTADSGDLVTTDQLTIEVYTQ